MNSCLAERSLGGIAKIDKSGRPIALTWDARPIIMRQVFHKLEFKKYIFRLGAEGIKTRFFPHQLVVVVAGGPEILVHSARDWIVQSKGRKDIILVVLWISFPFGLRGVYVCQFKRTIGMSNDDGFILYGPQAAICRGSRNSIRNNFSIPVGICMRMMAFVEGGFRILSGIFEKKLN